MTIILEGPPETNGVESVDWWIKWVSSIFLIIGMILTSNNIFPINLYVSTIGIAGWVVVGMLWRDRSIMILNAIIIICQFIMIL